ncbi:chymotrypsinogen A-like [Pocillopora damicornis]|uniref:chymotrypsinogen A-like n=1 Tax=Pocillopora damicornis TaxID=46731 RepID=UPI000F553082|nr:chymotrypsinogen A-like [Pocillopora damicornis]
MSFFAIATVLLSVLVPSISQREAECGKRPFSARVVNGENATPHSWPWQVSLRVNGHHICGGSLIKANWIVTAAHCVRNFPYPQGYTVVVGAHRRKGSTSVQEEFDVKTLYKHDGFTMNNLKHDIAVLELKGSVKISDKVSPVCLPTEEPAPGTECYISGWGRLRGGGSAPDILQQAMIPIVSHEECKKKYERYDKQAHLCAGQGHASGSGGCQGDSGGPLVCEKDGTWYLHGAVSFGKRGCPTKYNTVFARITTYLPWIMDKLVNRPPAPTLPPKTPPPGCKDKREDCASNKMWCRFMPDIKRDCPFTCDNC